MPFPTIKRVSDNLLADFIDLFPVEPNLVRPVIELLPTRPNIDGHAVRKLSKQGRPYRWFGVRNFTSINGARVSAERLAANLLGQVLEITTRQEQIFQRLMCLDMQEARPPREINTLVGGVTDDPEDLWGAPMPDPATTALAYVAITVIHLGDEVT